MIISYEIYYSSIEFVAIRIHVLISRLACCLKMGFNLKILKMSPALFA